ncbi:hypothetical protein [Arenivirga flava]|nr:hypothetical protein [Arenivirga flava]
MTPLLGSVLDASELPLAELQAARLDGQLIPCAGRYLTIDAPDAAEVRAAVVHGGRSDRVIVELRSAAWVHGVVLRPPAAPQLCVSVSARTHRGPSAGLREVRFEQGDLTKLGGVLVTSPLRTALDLVRTADDGEHDEDRDAVRELLRLAGTTPGRALELLDARRKLPGKAHALRRLAALDVVGTLSPR